MKYRLKGWKVPEHLTIGEYHAYEDGADAMMEALREHIQFSYMMDEIVLDGQPFQPDEE